MTTEKAIRIMAGLFVVVSVALGADASPIFVSRHFLWVTMFVGANLAQSALTGFCPAVAVFRKLGLKTCREAALAERA
ncbi:MAG TPA: DUF2892 domain-containing protein [Anaeromyxobacter sp.]